MSGKAVKFGGSSLADARQFSKVRDIVLMDSERRYVVPSAPGKRSPQDEKITDLLYACHKHARAGADFAATMERVKSRYMGIAEALNLSTEQLEREFDDIRARVFAGASAAYCASRGEYLCGLLLSEYLGFTFIDAAEVVRFLPEGKLDEAETQALMAARLADTPRAVIPGFYGADESGTIHTFSRGGSDISGALVARAVNADVYENWTDVSGFLMADPRVVPDAIRMESISYRELRELSYMGATVLHEDAIFPVRKAGIPTNIRNTNEPRHPGTLIHYATERDTTRTVTGIAGRKGFSIISIEKDMMNAELGFGRRVLRALEEFGVSFEHLPTGIDTMCVVVESAAIANCRQDIIRRISALTEPDTITIHDHLALIATVGRGMVRNYGTAARLFAAISAQGISIRTIDQGSSEISIIVGVDEADYENAVRAIYDAFVRV